MSLEFPPIYLLPCHFEKKQEELHKLEKQIGVVWDIKEATLVLGKLTYEERAKWQVDIILGVVTEDVDKVREEEEGDVGKSEPPRKRQKVAASTINGKEVIYLDSDSDQGPAITKTKSKRKLPFASPSSRSSHIPRQQKGSATQDKDKSHRNTIKVLKLEWYFDSLKAGELLPYDDYFLYEGRIPKDSKIKPTPNLPQPPKRDPSILTRAKADSPPPPSKSSFHGHKSQNSASKSNRPASQLAQLHHETTSEHEGISNLPPLPEYLRTNYSCERPTPLHCPNEEFVYQLRIIKEGRQLKNTDEHGQLAYASAVAAIIAYPYTITSAAEIRRLPKCGERIAEVWKHWKETGRVEEVDEIEADERLQCMKVFMRIHDVGVKIAGKFYDMGYRDLDDLIAYEWNSLTRNQQIGLKYYDEINTRIPRPEVESIAITILSHANTIRPGFQMVICGGYRRGSPDCGDVDVVLTHPDEEATNHFLRTLTDALEDSGCITHILTLATTNSKRDQEPLKLRSDTTDHRVGFDTLDHAFTVWQTPTWSSMKAELKKDPNAKNPNLHRRVDIIISPWKTAGCAVIGWSGGLQFQRDLRRFCREKLGWKFDSSGVRKLGSGEWVDLEGGEVDLLGKEKKVFEGLGVGWREPGERCTD